MRFHRIEIIARRVRMVKKNIEIRVYMCVNVLELTLVCDSDAAQREYEATQHTEKKSHNFIYSIENNVHTLTSILKFMANI